MKKRIACFLLAAACILPAASAAGVETVHATYWEGYYKYDGVAMWSINANNKTVDPVQYNGTVYFPVRTAGEWMGAEVEWDQDTLTVELTTGGEPVFYPVNSVETVLDTKEERAQYLDELWNGFDITIRPDITIKIDGEVQEFRNVLGEPVSPIVFKETVYLPLRSIGELLGKKVLWIPQKELPGGWERNPKWETWDYELFHSEPEYTMQETEIQLYDQPSEEELAEVEAYIAQLKSLYLEFVEGIQAFLTAETMDRETTIAALEDLSGYGARFRAVLKPKADFIRREARLVDIHSMAIDQFGVDFYLESVRRGSEDHESLKKDNKFGDWCCRPLVSYWFNSIPTMEALVEGMRGN